jgi:hypothetical protein
MNNNHEKSNHEKNNTELPPMAPAMPFKPLWLKELKGGEEYCNRVGMVNRNFDCSNGINYFWGSTDIRMIREHFCIFYPVA